MGDYTGQGHTENPRLRYQVRPLHSNTHLIVRRKAVGGARDGGATILLQLAEDPHNDEARLRLIKLTLRVEAARPAWATRALAAQGELAAAHILSLEYRVIKTLAQADIVASTAKILIGFLLH